MKPVNWSWSKIITVGACVAGMAMALADGQRTLGATVDPSVTGNVSATSYAGQATVINIGDIHNFPSPIVICNSGALPGAGGFLESTVLGTNVDNGALTLELAHATTSGDGPEATSTSSLNNLVLEIMAMDGTVSTLRASYISSEATASCEPNGKVDLVAGVRIEGLVLNGESISVSRKPNQVVNFPGGKIIINEQTTTLNGSSGGISVVAIHVLVEGCMNGIIGSAQAGIACGGTNPPPPNDCGKLTGGGWIVGTPSGDKGTFGVSGGIRRGQYWGHLNYIDHGTGMHIRSTSVTGFSVDATDPDCRIITYDVLINGFAGTAIVRACDKGEPGRNDIFDITLSNGYHAGGDLGGNDPGGGNIQLHKCPPGWQ